MLYSEEYLHMAAFVTHVIKACYVSPTNIYLLKVSDRNTRERCKMCSNLTIIKRVFVVNFEHVPYFFLLFLLLTLNNKLFAFVYEDYKKTKIRFTISLDFST